MTPRPKKHAHEKRSEPLQLRLLTSERETLKLGSKVAGQNLSDFIRKAAIEKALRLLGRNADDED